MQMIFRTPPVVLIRCDPACKISMKYMGAIYNWQENTYLANVRHGLGSMFWCV